MSEIYSNLSLVSGSKRIENVSLFLISSATLSPFMFFMIIHIFFKNVNNMNKHFTTHLKNVILRYVFIINTNKHKEVSNENDTSFRGEFHKRDYGDVNVDLFYEAVGVSRKADLPRSIGRGFVNA